MSRRTCATSTTGKVFYGKDAFEGLHTPRPHDGDQAIGRRRPHLRHRALGTRAAQAQQRAARRGRPCHASRALARGRDGQPSVRAALPRHPRRQGIPARRRRVLPERDGAVPQPVGLPACRRRDGRRLQGTCAGRAAGRLDEAKAEGVLVPSVAWGYFPANADGNDLVIYADDERSARAARVSPSLASARSRTSASPTSSARVSSGEKDYVAFQIMTIGSIASERTAELFEANRYLDYVSLHGLSVEMTEALAELWHRRIREEWGFADEDGPTLHGSVPPAAPRRPVLLRLPGLPGSRGQRQGRGSPRGRPNRRDCERRIPAAPRADAPSPSSATTRRRSTSSPKHGIGSPDRALPSHA